MQWILFKDLNQEIREHGTPISKSNDLTWKLRNQIFESRIENVRIWSMKGFAFRADGGTPNTLGGPTSINILTMDRQT